MLSCQLVDLILDLVKLQQTFDRFCCKDQMSVFPGYSFPPSLSDAELDPGVLNQTLCMYMYVSHVCNILSPGMFARPVELWLCLFDITQDLGKPTGGFDQTSPQVTLVKPPILLVFNSKSTKRCLLQLILSRCQRDAASEVHLETVWLPWSSSYTEKKLQTRSKSVFFY